MKPRILWLLISALSALLPACRKEDSAGSANDTYASLSDFFVKNATASEYFSMTNSTGATIRTSRGTSILFPANAFVASDNTLVDGKVDIEVKEIPDPAGMILNDRTSLSPQGPLESAGEFYIGAKAGSRSLRLAPGKNIQVDLPSTGVPMNGMQVYNGYVWGSDSVGPPGKQGWAVNTRPGNSVGPTTFNTYEMFCDSISWINCDKLLDGTRIFYSVLAGNAPDGDQTRVYIHFTGRNSVVTLYRYGNSTLYSGSLVEAPATIIGICIRDGALYASITTTTLKNGQSSTLNFSKTDVVALKAALSALR